MKSQAKYAGHQRSYYSGSAAEKDLTSDLRKLPELFLLQKQKDSKLCISLWSDQKRNSTNSDRI
jgi:hypothetical protein